jgi:hypothetical protein
MSLEYQVPQSRYGAVFEEVLPHDFVPGESDADARRRLAARIEAESRVTTDKYLLSELKEDHPMYAEALQAWLKHEKQMLIESGVAIDDEMLAEAEILDGIIAEVNEEHEDPELIKLAEVMKDIREAEHVLHELQGNHSLAA